MTAPICPHLAARGDGWLARDEPITRHPHQAGDDETVSVAVGTCPACDSRVVCVSTRQSGTDSAPFYTTPWTTLAAPGGTAPELDIGRAVQHATRVFAEHRIDLGPDGTYVLTTAILAALTGGGVQPTVDELRRWDTPLTRTEP